MTNTLFIILMSVLFGACGTTQHHREWHEEQDKYKQECINWFQTVGKKKFERKEGEETLSVQDVMVARCQEDPSLCSPPKKPSNLVFYEQYWKVDETEDYCGKFRNDFKDNRFEEN